MQRNQEIRLEGFLKVTVDAPSFLIPIFSEGGVLKAQNGGFASRIGELRKVEVDIKEVVELRGADVEWKSIGNDLVVFGTDDQSIYAFQFDNGRIIAGSAPWVAERLIEDINELKREPFAFADVCHFLKMTADAEVQRIIQLSESTLNAYAETDSFSNRGARMSGKKALLAGINDYRSVSDLRGCVSDVQKYQKLLTELYGFRPEDIVVLKDEQVTKEQILSRWDWLLRDAHAGDQLVFMFAGHGSYVPDQGVEEAGGGDEPDGVDEILCLYDMDFEDPKTFLRDDEIFAFTKRLPPGVSLTIIFDSCHSGTATRMLMSPDERDALPLHKTPLVDIQSTLARQVQGARALGMAGGEQVLERMHQPRNRQEGQSTVLARFIEPPPAVSELLSTRGVRGSFRDLRDERDRPMNHIFLAGSNSKQTSADAFIDGNYHGAFSYYFCQTVHEAGGKIEYLDLIEKVRHSLSAANFSQTPQLEPEGTTGLLLGSTAARPSETPEKKEEQTTSPPPRPGSSVEQQIAELKAMIESLRVSLEKLSVRNATPPSGKRALVYVHGICQHKPGYSDGWWNALAPHLSPALRAQLEKNRREVLWSDLVSPQRALERDVFTSAERALLEQREKELARYLRDVVEDRALRETLSEAKPGERALAPINRGLLEASGLNCVDDFAKYLLSNMIRREVQQRFLDVVRPLLEQGGTVDVISHSWGTVVAYEALRALDVRTLPGRVRNLFTVGAALSIVPIKNRLETSGFGKPAHVERWINLDAKRDFVGGALGPLGYAVDEEFLNLEPVGCRLFRDNPWCPHSSYFRKENEATNRDVFAKRMS